MRSWIMIFFVLIIAPVIVSSNIEDRKPDLEEYGELPFSNLDRESHDVYFGSCGPWNQVNKSGFGLDSQDDYASEEGFEVLLFDNRLYLGMEADNSLGARLWRTKEGVAIPHSQVDFEEVAASPQCDTFSNPEDPKCDPFGEPDRLQNDHIDSLAEFDGYLYVSTANGGDSLLGTRIYRSESGNSGSWQDAIGYYGPGFGDIYNTNFKDMQAYGGWLCGGTRNILTGAQVWCTSDGISWEMKNIAGFGGSTNNPENVEIWSGQVFENSIYFGVQNVGADGVANTPDDVAFLYRTQTLLPEPGWEEVYKGNPGSKRVDILGVFDGQIFISYLSADGVIISRSPTGDQGSWVIINQAGMDGDGNNEGAVVDSSVVYNGALYVAIYNDHTGVEVWRTTGNLANDGLFVDWEQVDGNGLSDPNNIYAELIVYNGYLYAWTSNYMTGQQVLRSKCPICERKKIASTGTEYKFLSVGATLGFEVEDLEEVEVCVFPGAPPDSDHLLLKPLWRHYQINSLPTIGTEGKFIGELTLSYQQEEYVKSSITAGESALSLAREATMGNWVDCKSQDLLVDPDNNTVRCSYVTNFSNWGIVDRYSVPGNIWLPMIAKKN